MTKGLIIGFWDKSKGMQSVTHYPQDVVISEGSLTHIYALHVSVENQPPAILESIIDGTKYISYRSGPEQRYFFILAVDPEESADLYEDGFIESLQLFIQSLHNNQYMDNILDIHTLDSPGCHFQAFVFIQKESFILGSTF